MKSHFFIFGGVDSRDYGVLLSGPGTTDAPQRDVTAVEVPGRSGSLLIDNGRYTDIKISYTCAIITGFEGRFAALRNALLRQQGYTRLEDTIHPDEYRLASFTGPIKPETTPFNRAGEFDLEFTCKPQRFLRSGEQPLRLTRSGAVLHNPGMPALPLITVYGAGAGTLSVAGVTVSLLDTFSGPLTLDCDTQNAFWGFDNKNREISAPAFPALPGGDCPVSWTGGVERVDIVPRWWTL